MTSANESWDETIRVLAGDRLRRTRAQQRLSVRQVAERASVSKTSVVQVEAGRSSRRATYVKVAEALGLHVDRLTQPVSGDERPYAVHRLRDSQWFDLVAFGEGPLPQDSWESDRVRADVADAGRTVPLSVLASRLERGRIKPTILELHAPSPIRSHAGEERVFVLSGRPIVTIGGEEVALDEGESVMTGRMG